MELDIITIGNRIKKRRKELKLTQIDIKDKVGISSGNMSDIENGNRLPAATTLAQLSEVLQCSVDYLLTGKTPEQENFIFSQNGDFSDQDIQLINLFHGMTKDDQEELMMIARMKYNRAKNDEEMKETSSTSHQEVNKSEIA